MKKRKSFNNITVFLSLCLVLISVCGCAEKTPSADDIISSDQNTTSFVESNNCADGNSKETSESSHTSININSSVPSDTSSKTKVTTSANNVSSKNTNDEKINVYGNTQGNLNNNAWAAGQGDWIYYSTFDAIYKMKKDGTANQKICNYSGISMSVCGDWIYFSEDNYIYSRIRTDGTNYKKILKDVSYLTVVNRKIYYTDKETGYMYRIDENGRNKVLLIKQDCGRSVNVLEDMIFWSEGENFYRSDINGKNIKCVENFSFNNIVAYKGYLYESANVDISDYNGKFVKQLFENGGAMDINISDDWIYFSYWDDKGCIYKCKLDGSGMQKLNDISATDVTVVGNWIFYLKMEYEDNGDGTFSGHSSDLYRMKIDGSDNQIISKWDWSYLDW